ncbi:uncharacterized protein LOC141716658 [Apium graveolens]|uniref:uncharacterized protein LOC141716658 n=1 Tax=Apium graveolens TaxID=4045 RepID=UPI003D79546C
MATMTELPYELLCYIIILLVQSPGGAADFARIVSVCRNFILFTQDERILKAINFDIKMELKNFKRYQHIDSLLVKCSEARNVAAQFLLGKVILVSSSQLLLVDWQKVEHDFHPCDSATLSELRCILATNVPTQDHEVGSFMEYFLPEQESDSEVSETRLVHYQLVKVFLIHGSYHDLAEMSVFLKSYIQFFTSVTDEDGPLLQSIKALVSEADNFRRVEKRYMLFSRRISGCECISNALNRNIGIMKRFFEVSRAQTVRIFEQNLG